MPEECSLRGVPTFRLELRAEGDGSADEGIARRVAYLMSLLASWDASSVAKASQMWLGEGLGTVSKRLHERMMRLEFVD